jgi:tRNA threonylcarbamoyladenosine biosynthesis protein TsaB
MRHKPLILALETSGRMGSVAIAVGRQILDEAAFSGPMRHSSEVFPAIYDLLNRLGRKPKDIEHVYISIGPGSFTGLRIAVSIAKTMHLANAVKVVAVDTLDVIAANIDGNIKPEKTGVEKVAVVLDAKRCQFYIAVYQSTRNGKWKKFFSDSLMTSSQFLEKFAGKDKPVWLLGEGLVYYKDKFIGKGIRHLDERYWNPRAEKVHLLGWEMASAGQFADPLILQPKYLRRPEAEEKRKSQT